MISWLSIDLSKLASHIWTVILYFDFLNLIQGTFSHSVQIQNPNHMHSDLVSS